MSAVLTSPLLTSGAFFQKVAVSCSQLSLTTSHSSLRIAARSSLALSDVAGFWPTQNMPFTLPSFIATNIGHVRVVADDLRVPVVAELVLLGGGIAVHRLQIRDHELRHVRPVARRHRLRRR